MSFFEHFRWIDRLSRGRCIWDYSIVGNAASMALDAGGDDIYLMTSGF
jgi:hypothetical protein